MTQTTIELVPNVYQEIVDDAAGTLTKQWKISGTWTTTAIEYGFAPNTGLEYNVGGDKVPYVLGTLATSYATNSATNVATGHTATITPTDTQIELLGSITVENSIATSGVTLSLYRTVANGSAPAAGSAHGGSDVVVLGPMTVYSVYANQSQQVGFDFVDSGLTAGAAYTYYVVIQAVTSGYAIEIGAAGTPNGSVAAVNASTIELQNI